MPHVAVRAAFDLTGPRGQQRLTAIPRLDLGLLVHRQHQRPIRRVEVQPDGVPHFFDEQLVLGQLEGLAAMRLQNERPPDGGDRALAEATPRRHGPAAPMGRVAWRSLQRQGHHFVHLGILGWPSDAVDSPRRDARAVGCWAP